MDDLTTLPSSVKYQLARSQDLAEMGRHAEAQSSFREVAATLASSNPELCASLIAMGVGHTDLILTETQERSEVFRNESYVWGFRVGEDVKTAVKTTTTTRRISFRGPNGSDL